MMLRIARVTSSILSPLTLMMILSFFAITRTESSSTQKILIASVLTGFIFIPSIVTLFFLKFTGYVSDWSISKRSQRYLYIPAVILYLLISIIVLKLLNLNHILPVLILLLSGGILFGLTTLVTKISAHTAAITLVSLFLIDWYGGELIWTILGVALVSWSRLKLKHHTPLQAVMGVMLSVIIFVLAKYFLLV